MELILSENKVMKNREKILFGKESRGGKKTGGKVI